ncbi:MAG: hypothetical protein LBI61_03060 [Puniceicoccales bacterium]|jgi:hypothetical protein|nr:hypothetical protein [Puniceicoccales bacterium]
MLSGLLPLNGCGEFFTGENFEFRSLNFLARRLNALQLVRPPQTTVGFPVRGTELLLRLRSLAQSAWASGAAATARKNTTVGIKRHIPAEME